MAYICGMSNMKHTPGPWTVDPEIYPVTIGEQKHTILPVVSDYVAEEDKADGWEGFGVACLLMPDCTTTDKDREMIAANARLIAAAPDLLEALQKITDLRYGYDGDCGAVAIAQAAISKATEQ